MSPALRYRGPNKVFKRPAAESGISCHGRGPRTGRPRGNVGYPRREAKEHTEAARAAMYDLPARAVDAVILGCTEIPLLLGDESDAPDLLNPAALLAEAVVRFSIGAS
jgi:hypothetical protein